jgi:hypothetical protein
MLGSDGGERDHDHWSVGDVQQLVRDAPDQPPHPPDPASPDDDLICASGTRNVGNRLGWRAAEQLRLVLRPRQQVILQRKVTKQSLAAIPSLGENSIVVGGPEEVRRELIGVDDEYAAARSCLSSGEHERGACSIGSVVTDDECRRRLSRHLWKGTRAGEHALSRRPLLTLWRGGRYLALKPVRAKERTT